MEPNEQDRRDPAQVASGKAHAAWIICTTLATMMGGRNDFIASALGRLRATHEVSQSTMASDAFLHGLQLAVDYLQSLPLDRPGRRDGP